MATTSDTFLDEKVREIHDRLTELRPLVDEYQRLEAAERALAGVATQGNGSSAAKPQRRRAANSKRGRPRGSGNRSAEALEVIKAAPEGIGTTTLAKQMGIKPNYLYRVLPQLAQDGKVVKDGTVWKAAF